MRFLHSLYSAILALQSILALLQLLDAFQIWYYPMIHRYAYSLKFGLGFSLAPILLILSSIVIVYLLREKKYRWVLVSFVVSVSLYPFIEFQASIACLSILLVFASLLSFRRFGDFMYWVLVLLTGFEGLALVHWLLLLFGFVSPLVWLADLELALFYVFAHLAPLIVFSILIIVVLKFLFPQYIGLFRRFFRLRLNLSSEFVEEKIRLHPRFLLALSLVVALVAALYPYSPSINPERVAFGVDVHYYLDWMVLVEQDLFSVFTAQNGSRPVMLLLIYAFQHGFGMEVLEVVKYLPVLLNPLLVLSVFFMVYYAAGDLEWAGLASLFSASGFTMTVGMYSYFITNVLGLVMVFVALGFLFKTIRTGSKKYLASASVLGSLAVFTHPWTFTQYYAATVLFLVYVCIKEKRTSGHLHILTYLGLTGLADFLKLMIGGLEAYGALTLVAPDLFRVGEFWSNNIFAFRQMYGGLLSNVVLLVFAMFGVYLLNRRKPYPLFLMLLLLVSLTYYVMVDGSAQTKLLYNIPFSVLAALGILFLVRETTFDRRKKIAVLLFTVFYMMVYLLRSLANLL